MKVKSVKELARQRAAIVVAVLAPVVLLSGIFGTVGHLYATLPSFGMDESKMPGIDEFLPANYTDLAAMAAYFDHQFETHHMPLNYTVHALFTDTTYDTVDKWLFTDNAALWSGTAMAAYIGKLLAARREGNGTMEADAMRVILKLLHGMEMMLAVPNGGLGPEHGTILARMWAPPENATMPGMPLYNLSIPGARSPYAYYNGTGAYSNWRYSDFTSLDEHGGYYMGLALAWKHVNDTGVRQRIGVLADQLCNGLLHTNFLGIGGFGGPTGVDQKMRGFQGGTWSLLVLKLGALTNPDKYERLYHHFAVDQGIALFTNEGGAHEIIANYYAYNFGYDVVFALLELEDDPVLRAQYLKTFTNGLWAYTRTHRNAHFNIIHLIVNRFAPGEDLYYEKDIEDQLHRFKTSHFPNVVSNYTPPPASYEFVDLAPWQLFFQAHAVGNMLAPLFFEFNIDKGFYDRPITVEYCRMRSYVWGGSPFAQQNPDAGNELVALSGISFLTPYWLARGHGFLNATGVRTP